MQYLHLRNIINIGDEAATSYKIWWAFIQYFCSKFGSTVYSRYRSALGLIHPRSLGGSTFVFRYHSLRGDTAMPGRLYAGLCHAFLVIINIIVIIFFALLLLLLLSKTDKE